METTEIGGKTLLALVGIVAITVIACVFMQVALPEILEHLRWQQIQELQK